MDTGRKNMFGNCLLRTFLQQILNLYYIYSFERLTQSADSIKTSVDHVPICVAAKT